ncbi:hypothetical protein ACWDCL_10710 [Streptomyces sp. NPDC001009]
MGADVKARSEPSGKWEILNTGFGAPGSENIELAQLVVENPGRTAITVCMPGLVISGAKNKDYRISPRFFELKDFGVDSSTAATSVRIDPYDRVTFLLDYWAVMPRLSNEANGHALRMRGCISVAGMAQPCLSSKRLAWSIPFGAWTARDDIRDISPFTVIWRELLRANKQRFFDGDEGGGFVLGVIVRKAMQVFSERPSVEDFIDALRKFDRENGPECFQYAGLIVSMDEILDRCGDNLSAWAFTAAAGGLPERPDVG